MISLCSNFFGQVDDTGFYESKVSIWRKKNVLTNLCLFHLSFADLEQKNQGFFRKTIGSVVKMADHVSKEIFCREFFFQKSSFSISALGIERTFSVISTEVCRSLCQYCFLFVNWTSFWWTNVCPNFFLQHLRTFSKNLSVFFRKSFGQLNKTAFYESRGKFEYKTLFWQRCCLFFSCSSKIERRNNGFFCQKYNRQICDICLPRIQEHFLKKFFLKKFFFFIIGHWATFVCHFDEILSVQMSVLLSVCQFDQFVVKKFLSDNFFSIN